MADRLPAGLTPRLLPIGLAARYCSMTQAEFLDTIGQHVEPLYFSRGRGKAKERWDIHKIDLWLDQQSGITHAPPLGRRSIAERLNGDQGTRR
jgi:hypothetical protein